MNKEKTLCQNVEIEKYINSVKETQKNYDIKIENIRLKKEIQELKNETNKLSKAMKLLQEYKYTLNQNIAELERCNKILEVNKKNIDELKKINNDLYEVIQKIPKFIKKIFIRYG